MVTHSATVRMRLRVSTSSWAVWGGSDGLGGPGWNAVISASLGVDCFEQ
jgi:hypothetical protein